MQTESPILKRLEELDRSQGWLARKLGVHPSTVHRWVKHSTTFLPQRQREVALVLGVQVEELSPTAEVAA